MIQTTGGFHDSLDDERSTRLLIFIDTLISKDLVCGGTGQRKAAMDKEFAYDETFGYNEGHVLEIKYSLHGCLICTRHVLRKQCGQIFGASGTNFSRVRMIK
jgi:hypothetical protein